MTFRFSELWRWEGTIERGPYLLLGMGLFLLKYLLDRLIAVSFHRTWSVFNYLAPGNGSDVTALPAASLPFYATLLALALPFIWVGVALTLRRLRSAGLPGGLVFFFFVPILNVLFFLLLSLLPPRPAELPEPTHPAEPRRLLGRVIPEHPLGSVTMALLLTLPLGLVATVFGTSVLKDYGWGLFVGVPFTVGLGAAVLHGYHRPRTLGSCVGVACTAVGLLAVALLLMAMEGAVCIVMAAPIALALAVGGALVGYLIQLHYWSRCDVPPLLLLGLLLSLPALMGAEYASAPEAPSFEVRTVVEVNAPPERVWREVVTFPEIPPPVEWLFRAGIAYPISARIEGHGVGAVRHCVFSTGAFVEPIQVWNEPRRLKFSVTDNPPPMKEWSPYGKVHPPHLEGFLVSHGGEFLLVPLPGGRTRLEGATWYRHTMGPAFYWKVWSDAIIHRIHLRVLDHVKRLAERPVGRPVGI